MKKVIRFLGFLTFCLFAGVAAAADDITVTFQRQFIEDKLKSSLAAQYKNAINDIREKYDPLLPTVHVPAPHVQVSRIDAKSLRVKASIDVIAQTGLPDDVLKIEMAFSFRFGCSGLDLDIPFAMESLKFAGVSYPADDIQRRVNETINSLERRLRETLKRDLPAPSRVRCPRVDVLHDSSVVMAVDLRPLQCFPGQTKHSACSRQYWGEGSTYTCSNGFWQLQSRFCESCADSPHPSCPRRPRGGGNPPIRDL